MKKIALAFLLSLIPIKKAWSDGNAITTKTSQQFIFSNSTATFTRPATFVSSVTVKGFQTQLSNTASDTLTQANAAAIIGDSVNGNATLNVQGTVSAPFGVSLQIRDVNNITRPMLLQPLANNVGVGTLSPQGKVHMSSGTLLLDGNVTPNLRLLTSGASTKEMNLSVEPSAGFNCTGSSVGDACFRTESASNGFDFSTNGGATRLQITGTGLVGIGTTSPASTAALTIAGGLSVSGSAQVASIKFNDSTTQASAAISASTWSVKNFNTVAVNGVSGIFGGCTSTVTITLTGTKVHLIVSGSIGTNASQTGIIWVLEDGAFLGSESATLGATSGTTSNSIDFPTNVNKTYTGRTTAQHNYCVGFGGNASITFSAAVNSEGVQFLAEEAAGLK